MKNNDMQIVFPSEEFYDSVEKMYEEGGPEIYCPREEDICYCDEDLVVFSPFTEGRGNMNAPLNMMAVGIMGIKEVSDNTLGLMKKQDAIRILTGWQDEIEKIKKSL